MQTCPPRRPASSSSWLYITAPLAFFPSDTQRRRRKPHPPLSSYSNHLVTRAFGLRYFTSNYRGYPHPKRRRRRRPPRHIFSKRSCCSRLVFLSHCHPPTTGFIPLYFLFRRPTSSRAPIICLTHYHMLFLCIVISTICISVSSASLFASIPFPRWVIRLPCTECNNRSDLRLR